MTPTEPHDNEVRLTKARAGREVTFVCTGQNVRESASEQSRRSHKPKKLLTVVMDGGDVLQLGTGLRHGRVTHRANALPEAANHAAWEVQCPTCKRDERMTAGEMRRLVEAVLMARAGDAVRYDLAQREHWRQHAEIRF